MLRLSQRTVVKDTMYAYSGYADTMSNAVKAVWIVDDDRSIRWVLEKALAREAIPHKTFASVDEVQPVETTCESPRRPKAIESSEESPPCVEEGMV